LGDAPDGSYGWLVVDAFNSDAIPTHLLTREALALYLAKLAPDGLLAFHVTNHFLDLEPVLAAAARGAGLSLLIGHDEESAGPVEKFASDWAVMARAPEALAPLRRDPRWREPRAAPRAPWTDDYSNVFGIIRWN
jgi:spermidine synthase